MMKYFLIMLLFFMPSCYKSGSSSSSDKRCGTYNGHQLYKGSQGGCYYINSNGNKTYVDASHCSGC